jgi:mono/diheme cytochrome c family protein
MNRLAAVLCSLACLPLCAGPAFTCPVVQHAVQTVATPAIVTTFAPVLVPTYSASYQPAGSDAATLQLIREHHDRLTAIERQLAGQAGNRAVPPGPVVPAPTPLPPMQPADLEPGAVRFAANCARCHDAAIGKPKGDLALFRSGVPADLTCEQALACINALAEDRMPKGNKLEKDEDGPLIVAWLSKRAKTTKPSN